MPETLDLAFRLRRKKFTIEVSMFHGDVSGFLQCSLTCAIFWTLLSVFGNFQLHKKKPHSTNSCYFFFYKFGETNFETLITNLVFKIQVL